MRKFGLIGKSLVHSRSKDYFHQKFFREHLSDCGYENYPLDNLKDIRQMIINDPDLAGLNITIPYKTEIIQYLDELSREARVIGAVNCIKIIRNGNLVKITGYNTDAAAFRETLKPLLLKEHNKALVLGTGGASRAVCHALNELHIGYKLVSRKKQHGSLTYSDLTNRIIEEHRLIINATPVGMFPDAHQCPTLPYEALTIRHLLYDLIYNPEETLFFKKGKEVGAQVINGLEMLHLQAEMSWKVWNT